MKPLRSSVIGGLAFAIVASVWALTSWLLYPQIPQFRWLEAVKDITLIVATAALIGWIIYTSRRRLRELGDDRAELEAVQQRQATQLKALSDAVERLNSDSTLSSTLEYICRSATLTLGADAGTVTVYQPEGGIIDPAATYGLSKVFAQHFQPIAYSGSYLQATGQTKPYTFSARDDGLAALPFGPLYREAGYKSVAYLPLHDGSDFLGELTLLVADGTGHAFTPDGLLLLKAFADEASMAIRNERLKARSQENSRRLETLRATDLAILSSLDLNLTLRLFLREVVEQLRADAADVLLLNPASQALEFAAGLGFLTKALEASRVELGIGFSGKIALERRSMYIADVNAAEPFTRRELILGEGVVTYFGTPLVAKGQVKGVLEIFHRRPFYPEDSWLSFVETLAGQAAIAIDNASLFANLQQTNINLALAYDRTLEGWSRALDLRDRETEGHTERVTALCVRLARAMNVLEPDLVHIRRGALLHDIGKMAVPDRILLKPGQFDDEDEQVMRKHPESAFEMLSPITFLQPALEIPYCHHERWDGTGYPRGLRGEVIPLSARIFAVVDVWDALTTDRPYRKALTRQAAAQYLREQAGRQFDPSVVDAFMKTIGVEGMALEAVQ